MIALKKDFTEDNKQLKFSAKMEEPASKYVSLTYIHIHNTIIQKVNN